jgi:putative DNA methylase
MTYRKKLIEVALPLEAINKLSAEEKAVPRRGHPQTIHLWWSRKPLATCRAVLFAPLIDDPSSHPERFPTEEAQLEERKRLFRLIERLVKWENSNNLSVLTEAKAEILNSTDGNPPPVLDPFCGGGSIPLEAQRLGLEAHASDLNPVPVLINKALIEIPPKFAGKPPVNAEARRRTDYNRTWIGAEGLAEDVRYYGQWVRDEAEKRIGHFYPKVKLPKEQGSGESRVLAWFWARTVKCPNPACGAVIPLARSFTVSAKKEKIWAEPVIDRSQNIPVVRFEIKTSTAKPPEGTVNRKGATCICCSTPVPFDYIRAEGKAERMGAQLTAIVAEGQRQRVYLSPNSDHEALAASVQPKWKPETDLPEQALGFRVQLYGITKHADLFNPRQLVALSTFSNLISEAREQVLRDAIAAGMPDDGLPLSMGGMDAIAYADAVTVYLSCALSRLADYNDTICAWNVKGGSVRNTFARQAISMSWEFIEINPLEKMSGNWIGAVEWVSDVLNNQVFGKPGFAIQQDAVSLQTTTRSCISTDPPYYDQIGYANLSDFFYVWLRSPLSKVYPSLFSTLLTPKTEELVATPYRFSGNKRKAQTFFEEGLYKAFSRMRESASPDYPLTVYYAFKQTETDDEDGDSLLIVVASTGWQFEEGKYGDAETLSKAKNTSVTGLVNSGILKAKGGKVQLLRRDELPDNWTPEQDDRTPDWEVTQHLIWTLDQKGETGASVLLSKLGERGEVARDLAYRLYSICDRKSWTQEAIAYNSLVISWPEISRLAAEEHKQPTAVQGELEL